MTDDGQIDLGCKIYIKGSKSRYYRYDLGINMRDTQSTLYFDSAEGIPPKRLVQYVIDEGPYTYTQIKLIFELAYEYLEQRKEHGNHSTILLLGFERFTDEYFLSK